METYLITREPFFVGIMGFKKPIGWSNFIIHLQC